ncbi:MAG TPA: TIGR00645 family protein, partial [Marisediminicola sp.]|nr:TIGR00645 family protein [Marisediminicola sp.]
SVLKVKLATAIIGISSIHLLKTFIEVGDLGRETESVTGETYTADGVFWQVMIHVVFILSAIALAWIDKISGGAHSSPSDLAAPKAVGPSLPEHGALGAGDARSRPSDERLRAEYEALAARHDELVRELESR